MQPINMALPMKFIFAALATSILVWGIYDCITNFEQNGCEMTWMFEYPKYISVPLSLKNIIKNQYPNYKLYVYGEGEYADRISEMKFSGIPVLFIPGNAGSYKQVRSLGSVSLWMSQKPGVKFHFNYFVVDFNEEFSALHGSFLQGQTEFVHICIKKILSLYKSSNHPPSSVILVGHSMGGLVARNLFTLRGFDPQTVHTIITQASPHQAPVVVVDAELDQFYQRVNDFWYHHSNSSLQHVTVVSTGGGYRDYQVRSGLTSLVDIFPESRAISTTTMSVPLAWVSTDHLCSVWCRQMVLTTVKALFDIVDKKALQPTTDADYRSHVFRHHFLHHNGIDFSVTTSQTIQLDNNLTWDLRSGRTWRYYEKKVSTPKYLVVPLTSVGGEETAAITIISNITASNWICTCRIPEGQDKCSVCLSLVSRARLLPPRYSNRKFIRLSLEELGENTHIILFVPGSASKVEVIVDKYTVDTRHLIYELPGVYDTIISFPISVTDGTGMLQIRNNTAFYSLHLAGLYSPLTAYKAVVFPLQCSDRVKPGAYEGSVMMLTVPWNHENTYKFFRYGEAGSLPVKLQMPRQNTADDHYRTEHTEAHLEIYLHPDCHYQLKLYLSLSDTFGQFVRFYGVLLPMMFVGILSLALAGQLAAFAKDGECLWMPEAVYTYSKPFYMVPVAVVLHTITSKRAVSQLLDSLRIPPDDITELASRNLWLPGLPVMLGLLAWLVTILHCYMAHYALAALSRALGFLFCWVPEVVLILGGYLQLGIAIFAFGSSLTFCGTFGICLSYILLLIKVLRIYYLSKQPRGGKSEQSQYRFYFFLALLYMWLVVLNGPALIVWAKGVRHSLHLHMDPSRWTAVIATICSLFFITTDPLQKISHPKQLRWTIYAANVLAIPYCLVRLYRISTVILLTLTLIVSAQILSLTSRLTSKHHGKKE